MKHKKENPQCYKVDDVVKEVSLSESHLLSMEHIMIKFINMMDEGKDKEVKEYVHVISKSETLSNHEPDVLVSSKVQKIKIFDVKEKPQQSKHALWRKQPKPPDQVWHPLSSLKKEKPRRIMRKNRGTRGLDMCDLEGGKSE